ncbi:MAG: hypothetical protein IJ358_01180 [Clostridia bacterium]|nr:hypothetical protein [Clostridia bacterium]
MQKKKDYNYIYYFIQFVLVGLLIMFICTYFADVQATEVFRESKANILNCIYCLLFSFLPFILKRWNIHSTKTLQVYFLLAIIVHFILGGTLHYYRDVWFFSFIVHLINSFLIATIIYGILLRHCKNQSKFFMFMATVAFTALVGVLWEVCEYAIDGMSGSNMQRFNNSVTNEPFIGRVALKDTMIDLMMDTLGGLLAGLYFAFTNIKGVPLYKFLELKYVKADTNISYQEDIVDNQKLQNAKAEKKALKLEEKNNKRKSKIEKKQYNRLYKQEKNKTKKQQKLSKKQDKTTKKLDKQTKSNKNSKSVDSTNHEQDKT